jgi:hypothetical protein
LIPMQFKMDPEFATEFRVEAAKRRMKYNELLKAAFKHYVQAVPARQVVNLDKLAEAA